MGGGAETKATKTTTARDSKPRQQQRSPAMTPRGNNNNHSTSSSCISSDEGADPELWRKMLREPQPDDNGEDPDYYQEEEDDDDDEYEYKSETDRDDDEEEYQHQARSQSFQELPKMPHHPNANVPAPDSASTTGCVIGDAHTLVKQIESQQDEIINRLVQEPSDKRTLRQALGLVIDSLYEKKPSKPLVMLFVSGQSKSKTLLGLAESLASIFFPPNSRFATSFKFIDGIGSDLTGMRQKLRLQAGSCEQSFFIVSVPLVIEHLDFMETALEDAHPHLPGEGIEEPPVPTNNATFILVSTIDDNEMDSWWSEAKTKVHRDSGEMLAAMENVVLKRLRNKYKTWTARFSQRIQTVVPFI